LVQVDVGCGGRGARPTGRHGLPGGLQGAGLILLEVTKHRHEEGSRFLIGRLGGNRGALVLYGGGRIFVEGDRDVAEDLEIERAPWLELERGLVGTLGDAVVLGEEGYIVTVFA